MLLSLEINFLHLILPVALLLVRVGWPPPLPRTHPFHRGEGGWWVMTMTVAGGVGGGTYMQEIWCDRLPLFTLFGIHLGHFRGAPWTVSGMASGTPLRGPRNPPACLSLQSEFITIPRLLFFYIFPVNIKHFDDAPSPAICRKEDKRR